MITEPESSKVDRVTTGYGPRDRRLDHMLAKARAAQWSLEHDIDWSLDAKPTRWLPLTVVIKVVSQVYYGEIATARLCRHLRDEVVNPVARACLALQIVDEDRHAEAYRRYLERLGDVAPIDPVVELALESAANAPGGTIGRMVACHLVLESEALAIQEHLSSNIDCPLLTAINDRVAPDEARHVAFGRTYLAGRVTGLSPDERLAIHDWVEAAWRDCARATLDGLSGTRILVGNSIDRRLAAGWARQIQGLRDIGLDPEST